MEAFNRRMAAVHGGGSLVNCEHCGRDFHESAFKNHRKICTAARPFKPAPASAAPPGSGTRAAAAGGGAGALANSPDDELKTFTQAGTRHFTFNLDFTTFAHALCYLES
jgi:hypothetical protein